MWPWSRKKEGTAPVPPEAAGPSEGPSVATQSVAERVLAASARGHTEVALAALSELRASPEAGTHIDDLLRRTQAGPLPEPVALGVAALLVERGDLEQAERCVSALVSAQGLFAAADIAAERDDLALALSRIERVLLRSYDFPGARERHRRWRAAMGLGEFRAVIPAGATTMSAKEPDAPFDILREVARGGAGAVYEATDRELRRTVALKVYHQPDRDRGQLLHEARVAGALAGDGVIRVYDADPEHGWLALEWAALGALRDRLRQGVLDGVFPLQGWVPGLVAAPARVHAAGWVHHDVKPANVLLAAPGAPLLADFGIARRGGEPAPAGSMGYMSPERLRGRPSDPRDDVYGFGRVLEDVLEHDATGHDRAKFGRLAAACTGPDEGRPADGRAILTRLRVELSL